VLSTYYIHNTDETAAGVLPVDIEGIVLKIYSYFYMYTIRVENLKVNLCMYVCV
jgi:hypothetical protein